MLIRYTAALFNNAVFSESVEPQGCVCVSLGSARDLLWMWRTRWQNRNTMMKAYSAETLVHPAPEGFIDEGRDVPQVQTQLLF